MKRNTIRKAIVLIIIISLIFLIISKKTENKKNTYLEEVKIIEDISPEIKETKQEEKTYYRIPIPHELQDYIRQVCEENDVDMKTFLGIMATESSFRNEVESKNNNGQGYSVGISQLNMNYINWYSELTGLGQEFNIHNIQHNILGGILVYKTYRDEWASKGYEGEELEKLTLLSYNRGVNGAKKYVSRYGYDNSYIRKVTKNKNNIEEERNV